MTRMDIIIKYLFVFCVILASAITPCVAEISDRRLCFDPKCSVVVSTAITLTKYNSNDPAILSFDSNVPVNVYSKGAGKRKELWGVEINEKRGYVPNHLILEKKVFKRTLVHEVPTELITNKSDNVPNSKEETEDAQNLEDDNNVEVNEMIKPDQISPSFEVHDGTTIPLAVSESQSEPSYATSTPHGSSEVDEQPILSIHPKIESTETLKNYENDNLIEDAEKYLQLTGHSEESLTNEETITKNLENELSDKSLPVSFKIETEKIFDDLANSSEISTDQVTISSIDESSKNVAPSSQDGLTESRIPDDDLSKKIIDNTSDNSEKESHVDENNNVKSNDEKEQLISVETPKEEISEQISLSQPIESVEEKTAEKPLEKVNEDESPEKSAENTTEVMIEKNLEKKESNEDFTVLSEVLDAQKDTNEEIEKNNENVTQEIENASLQKEEEKVRNRRDLTEPSENLDSSQKKLEGSDLEVKGEEDVKKTNDVEKEITENTEKMDSSVNDKEKLESQVSSMENDKTSESLENELKESKSEVLSENKVSVDEGNPIEKLDAEESTEDVPLNLNIMNPLFNSLSMLSSMVKGVNNLPSNAETEILNDQNSNEQDVKMSKTDNEIEAQNVKIETEIRVDDSSKDVDKTIDNESNKAKSETEDKKSQEITNTFEHDDKNNVEIKDKKDEGTADSNEKGHDSLADNSVQPGVYKRDEIAGFGQGKIPVDETPSFNGFPGNRNLLNVASTLPPDNYVKNEIETNNEDLSDDGVSKIGTMPDDNLEGSCHLEGNCQKPENFDEDHSSVEKAEGTVEEEVDIMNVISFGRNYWETFSYVVITAFTTLLFSLGYYYIEKSRRDGQYIAKINELEKQLLVCSKECSVLDDTLKSTKNKLDSIEDESFGSNEMVASLKNELETSQTARSELEDQVAMLEKELENATEAGFELERMLRETLSTNNEDNPLAQSIEDLQTRLNAQQAANEALTTALNLKAQENESLIVELKSVTQKSEQLEVEVTRLSEDLKQQHSLKNNLEQTLLEKVQDLETQVKDISAERVNLRKQLNGKEMELKDLLEVVNQMNINNLDFEKLYNVSKIKAEANQLMEERDELQAKLSEVEGAHQLLEEHVKLVDEEVSSLSEQCKLAEKAKRDAETRVEVLSNYFKEKEAQRQKEESVWLQKQGEVSSTVERLHTMQNEIHNYKQQIEMLKREILNQEREYKNQIASLETKSHENWVLARQNERRLEESKTEAGQLRNRLTLIEKNLNDGDPEAKLHRLEANGETATSPQSFIGAEASSSPIMFTGSSGVPLPPPPSYLYGPPIPPFIPPPPHSSSDMQYEVGQRPPPLGGRLASPPPPLLHSMNSGRYDNSRSPPLPSHLVSSSIIPPYGSHRSFPPPLHPPPPPPSHGVHLPPPLSSSSSHTWDDETPPSIRNSGLHHHHHHPFHRDNQPRARNHKGSLHSSGESLDKNL